VTFSTMKNKNRILTLVAVALLVVTASFAHAQSPAPGLPSSHPATPPPPPPLISGGGGVEYPQPAPAAPASTSPSQADLATAQKVLTALSLKPASNDAVISAPGSIPLPAGSLPGITASLLTFVQIEYPQAFSWACWIIFLIGSLTPVGKSLNYLLYEVIHTIPNAKDAAWLAKVQSSKILSIIDRVVDTCAGFSITHPVKDWKLPDEATPAEATPAIATVPAPAAASPTA
jgi:hypothetical protein